MFFLLQTTNDALALAEKATPFSVAVYGLLVISGWAVAFYVWKYHTSRSEKIYEIADTTNDNLKEMTHLLKLMYDKNEREETEQRRAINDLNSNVAKLTTVVETILQYRKNG